MRTTKQLSITLPIEMADKVRAKVESGAYASGKEVIRDGLRILDERDNAVDRWLRDEAVLDHRAYLADPSRGAPIETAFAGLKERALARKSKP